MDGLNLENQPQMPGGPDPTGPDPGNAPVFRRMRERQFAAVLDHPPQCTLAELRKSCHRTQAAIAAVLGVKQLAVSRLEHRADIHFSSLRSYVEALGGSLHLIVRLPRRAVRLNLASEE
jgi:hypothetical protein